MSGAVWCWLTLAGAARVKFKGGVGFGLGRDEWNRVRRAGRANVLRVERRRSVACLDLCLWTMAAHSQLSQPFARS